MALVNCNTLLPTLIDWIRHEATDEQIVLIQTLLDCEISPPDSTHDDVMLTVAPTPAPEGSVFTFTVGLGSPVVGDPLSVYVDLSGTEQTAHSYTSPQLVVIPAGASSGFFSITTINDAAGGGNTLLTGTVQLSARVLNAPTATATVTPLAGSCVPNFQPTATTQCNLVSDMLERQWSDGCGNTEWRDDSPLVWTQAGALTCVDNTLRRTEENNCGDERTVDTGIDCSTPCIPSWQPVSPAQTQCSQLANGTWVVFQLYVDGCGNEEWRYQRGVTWVDTGTYSCVDNEIWAEQVNDCGGTRNHNTHTVCCTPAWVDVPGVTQCSSGRFLQRQTDGCGNYQWVDRGEVVYTPVVPSTTRCRNNVVEVLEENQCGGTQWAATATPCDPLTLASGVTLMCENEHQFSYPCVMGNPETAQLSCQKNLLVAGGSGNYNYSFTQHPNPAPFLPVNVTRSGSVFYFNDPVVRTCLMSADGEGSGTVDVHVVDTVTGQAGDFTISYLLVYRV